MTDAAFDLPRRLVSHLRDFERPWAIAGGWALDLFVGYQSRPHCDIEMTLFRGDEVEFRRYLTTCRMRTVANGEEAPIAPRQPLGDGIHQLRATLPDLIFDVLLAEAEGDGWVYRRDRRIRRTRADVILP